MSSRPFILAICVIIAVGGVLILASGPGKRVSPMPGDLWTLTHSMPVSNSTISLASSLSGRLGPQPGDSWALTFSMPASNRPAAFQMKVTPQTR